MFHKTRETYNFKISDKGKFLQKLYKLIIKTRKIIAKKC